MNIKKICVYLLTAITLSCTVFCINFFISWSGNVAFESMIRVTVPFVVIASLCWFVYGIIADRLYKARIRKQKIRRMATAKKNNVIYLDSLISLGYYKKAC